MKALTIEKDLKVFLHRWLSVFKISSLNFFKYVIVKKKKKIRCKVFFSKNVRRFIKVDYSSKNSIPLPTFKNSVDLWMFFWWKKCFPHLSRIFRIALNFKIVTKSSAIQMLKESSFLSLSTSFLVHDLSIYYNNIQGDLCHHWLKLILSKLDCMLTWGFF